MFTFKKGDKPVGLSSIASPNADTDIKLNKKRVGYIRGPSAFGDNHWKIYLMVTAPITEECPAGWRWIRLKQESDTEQEARSFLKEVAGQIIRKYDLYQLKD